MHPPAPAPFNPDYDPLAAERLRQATCSMEADGFYTNHSRAECAAEVARRLELLKMQNPGGA